MYGPNIVRSGLTLTKVMTGLSRGLNLANQIIPLYQQAKPMISNARKMIGIVKEISYTNNTNNNNNNNNNNNSKQIIDINNSSVKEKKATSQISASNPVFFQ